MDFYQYYLHRLESASDPGARITSSAETAIRLIDEAPTIIGLEAGVGLLVAMHNYRNSQGLELAPIFEKVELAVNSALYSLRCDLELSDNIWSDKRNELETIDANVCPIPDGQCNFPVESAENEHSPGTSRHYPDYEHWNTWTDADWVDWQNYKKKVLAAASSSLSTMGLTTNSLAAVQQNLYRLPIEKRVEVAIWCTEVVDDLYEKLESELFEICRENLYSREGRTAHKKLTEVSSRQAGDVSVNRKEDT